MFQWNGKLRPDWRAFKRERVRGSSQQERNGAVAKGS